MFDYFDQLYRPSDFMPHGDCLVWDATLLWQHAGSDILTGIAYYFIAAALFYFIFKRRDIPFFWVFLLFASFILSCGTTHFFAAWTIYYPSYWTEGIFKTINALISLATALILIPLMPKLLALPSLQKALGRLKTSEERYRELIEGTNDLITNVDAQGNYYFVNRMAGKYLGLSPDECLGISAFASVHPDDRMMTEEWFRQCLVQKTAQSVIENRLVNAKTNEVFDMLWTSNFYYDEEGNPENVGGIGRDITDRKQIEDELRLSEQRYRTVTDNVTDIVWIQNMRGDFTFLSPSWETQTGFSVAEGLTMNSKDMLTPDSYAHAMTQFQQRLETDGERRQQDYSSFIIELENIRKDGTTFWSEITAKFLRDPAGNPIALTGVTRDISERKRAEDVLKKSRHLLAESEKIGNVGGWEINIDTGAQTWTEQTYVIHEVDQSYEPTVERGIDFYTPVSRPIIKRAVQRAIEYGEPFDEELEITTAKGNLRLVHVIGKSDLENRRIYGFFQDITERKQLEEAFQDSEERFRLMMYQSPVVTELYDLAGLQVEVNRAYEKLWGFPASRTVNKFNVLESKEVESSGLINYVQRAYAGEEVMVPAYEFDPRGKTEAKGAGRVRWLKTRIYPLKNRAGDVKNIVIMHEDITGIKYAEVEREKLESQLRQALKMEAIGTLAGGIAHDFNNILAAILGYAEMVSDEVPKSSAAQNDIQEVLKAGKRAKELVQHILAFSRKSKLERVPVAFHLVTTETLKLLRASIPTTIEIHQDIDPNSGTVLADPTQLHQIIMNICTNAAQAMDEKGNILDVTLGWVELSEWDLHKEPSLKPGKYVKLTISDNGPGIDQNIIERIFDPYFTTKGAGKGSGMGLAVVHGIVKSHDGMVTVASTLGKGTTFNIFFPRIDEKEQQLTERAGPVPTGNERILVVDDEESVVEITKRRLKRLGYQVTALTDSMAALELFRSQPGSFDLVISDQTMPGLTGEQLAKKIIAIRQDIPIVICTGYSSKMDADKANFLGISAFIMKPIDHDEFASTIRQVLDEKN